MGASVPQPINMPGSTNRNKADTDPITIDPSVTWDSIGGLDNRILNIYSICLV
jgi:hypothetical protein